MDKYRISAFTFESYEGSRILMCQAFSINPLESLAECVAWIDSLDFKPDFLQITYKDASCLFDTEDTRISNNIFYCNRH